MGMLVLNGFGLTAWSQHDTLFPTHVTSKIFSCTTNIQWVKKLVNLFVSKTTLIDKLNQEDYLDKILYHHKKNDLGWLHHQQRLAGKDHCYYSLHDVSKYLEKGISQHKGLPMTLSNWFLSSKMIKHGCSLMISFKVISFYSIQVLLKIWHKCEIHHPL